MKRKDSCTKGQELAPKKEEERKQIMEEEKEI